MVLNKASFLDYWNWVSPFLFNTSFVGVYSTLTSCSPPVTSMITTTTTTKSWRSDTLIILPGWECHTGGSRPKPTVHRCSQNGRRLWVAHQVHNHEPNGSAAVRQCQHGSGAFQIHSTISQSWTKSSQSSRSSQSWAEQCRDSNDTKLKLKADEETVKVVMISESLTS